MQFPPSVDEVMLNIGLGSQLFILPEFIKSILPDDLIYSQTWHRLPNFLLAFAICILIYKVSGKKWLVLLMALITPWFAYEAIFDFTGMLTLFLTLLVFWAKNTILVIVAILALSYTSLIGLIFALTLGILNFRKKPYLLALMLILITLIFRSPLSQLKSMTFFGEDDYSLTRASFEVNQRVREETRTNNYQDHIPLIIKRISYNKYFFWLKKITPHFTKMFNLEFLASPAQIHTTVSKSLWGEKRIPLIFFWQMLLIFIGLLVFKKIDPKIKILTITTIVSSIIATGLSTLAKFESQGLLLIIPVAVLASLGLQELKRFKLITTVLTIVAFVGVVGTYHHFFFHELHWRDNRPYVFTQLVKSANNLPANNPATITNILGPTQYYWTWIHRSAPPSNIEFRHFDLTLETPTPGRTYIGLPGEFLGNRLKNQKNDFFENELPANLKLVKSIPIKDAVSYGNGNFIWTVESL